MGGSLSFAALKCRFRNIQNIEKYIAIKNGKEKIHYAKWRCQDTEFHAPDMDVNENIQEYVNEYIHEI